MQRALVLGGGGPVGIAWESGLALGLEEQGVPVSAADRFIGTSAGSVVGSQLALGRPPQELYERQRAMAERVARESKPVDMTALIGQFVKLFSSERPQQELLAEMGAFALAADTISEEEWIAGFASTGELGAGDWPQTSFACTAIDTADGSFKVWDNDSGVPLRLAVASSCAVPGVFPPVTINGRRHMDGGVRSATNADLAAGAGAVIVVSVTSSSRRAAMMPALAERMRTRFAAELDVIRDAGGRVEVIEPDDEFADTFGMNLMDFTRREQAAEMGLRQGRREAERLHDLWR